MCDRVYQHLILNKNRTQQRRAQIMETDEKLWQHERMCMYDQNDAITITICSIVFDQKKRSVITIMTYILRQNVVETLHFVYAFCLCRMPVRKNVTIWYVFFCVLPLDVLPKRNRIQTNKQPTDYMHLFSPFPTFDMLHVVFVHNSQ